MKFNLKLIILFIVVASCAEQSHAIKFKDSTSALFLRASFKSFQGMYVENTGDSIFKTYSDNLKKPLGFSLGLRYSSTFKKIKNNRLSYWAVLDFQYDRFEELFAFDSFPCLGYVNYITDSCWERGYRDEKVSIKQGALTFQVGLKYNFRGIRPALGYFMGYNIFSTTDGVGEIAQRFGIFKENGRIINKLHHGVKFDIYVPIKSKTGIVAGIGFPLYIKVPNTSYKFNNIVPFLHIGIDYKISK